jgi:hypothetical protein
LGEALSLLDAPIAVQMHALAANPAARAGDPMISALNGLFDLGEELRDLSDMFDDFGGSWMANALSHGLGAIPVVKRARARGLTAEEMMQWTDAARAILTPEEQVSLAAYVQACRAWEQRLDKHIGSMAADPDWDMSSAPRVPASAPEAFLARSLEEVGIPMHAQVGVSRLGGRRHGGWFRAFWLDCAHRDVAFLLRLDVELDGATHQAPERAARDAMRNALLQARGWYVLRMDSRNLGRNEHYRACDVVVKLVRRHRRAVVLARSELPTLIHMPALQDVTSHSEPGGGNA